jgi:hypothetical protein
MKLYGVRVIIDDLDIQIYRQYYSSWLYKAILPTLKSHLKKQLETTLEEYITVAFSTSDAYLALFRSLMMPMTEAAFTEA